MTGGTRQFRSIANHGPQWRPIVALFLLHYSPRPVVALDLFPIEVTGFDQDIIFEAGLADGQVGANGELGSRQFFEEGVFADGVPRFVNDFTSTITGDVIDFNFAPFEGNNILKLDSTQPGPKTLTFVTPNEYGRLAIVHSGGSMSTTVTDGVFAELALVTYTINYAGGGTESGTITSADWAAITPENLATQGMENLLNADRTTANATTWPVSSDNNTTANRWAIRLTEITPTQPTVNIESIAFGPVYLNTDGTPLNSGDDFVVFGLSGSGDAPVLGDTNGNGIGGEYPDDFDPIRNNFRKSVTMKSEGDLVRNGVVDFADFREWRSAAMASGTSLDGLDFSLVSNVPEPSPMLLTILASLGVTPLRRKM